MIFIKNFTWINANQWKGNYVCHTPQSTWFGSNKSTSFFPYETNFQEWLKKLKLLFTLEDCLASSHESRCLIYGEFLGFFWPCISNCFCRYLSCCCVPNPKVILIAALWSKPNVCCLIASPRMSIIFVSCVFLNKRSPIHLILPVSAMNLLPLKAKVCHELQSEKICSIKM